jgi:tetratricopeptide (TPR) repeat protein
MSTTTEGRTEDKVRRRKSSKSGKPTANVIHVAFGQGGGRIPPEALGKDGGGPPQQPPTIPPPPAPGGEPLTDLFTPRDVAKLLGLTAARLRTLDKAQIVSPTGERGGKRCYTFQDLIALRATHGLLAHKVKPRDVAKAVAALRRTLPRVTRPLQELRIVSDGRKLIVRAEGAAFEPVSGQLVIDFQVNTLRDDVVRMLRPDTEKSRARTAYDLYSKASTLDEDPGSYDEAEKIYKRAIELDPHLAIAYTNLGNIRFRRADEKGAEELYRRALEIDDRQPEAHYNLGYVLLERGDAKRSVPCFQRALDADPRFGDAHFNLAMAYEQIGERAKARPHWKRYLEIEPTGTWAEIAKQHL